MRKKDEKSSRKNKSSLILSWRKTPKRLSFLFASKMLKIEATSESLRFTTLSAFEMSSFK